MGLTARLPDRLRDYVATHVVSPRDRRSRVRLTQVGQMQLRPGRWLSFRATQEIAVTEVRFDWRARFRIAPLVGMNVVDWYRSGEGGLEGKLLGVVPVVRSRGPELAKGEAMRYLAELPWAPLAIAWNRELEWREVDGQTVEVATSIGATRAAVRLHFDPAGELAAASAAGRPRAVGAEIENTPFVGRFGDFAEVAGLRVPRTAEANWLLPEGEFTYFRCRVTALDCD